MMPGPAPLTTINQAFLDTVTVQPVHEMRYTLPDGHDIQGWYILPVGHQPGKPCPLIVNIHGGPHIMWGAATQSIWHENQSYAAAGYAVFYCNPRGAAGYGEAFQIALHARWGDLAFADIMAGVDLLINQGIADPDRLAVTGGSYGGYMTAWIVSHTHRFKAAVSQRGVYNLLSFFGTTDIPLFLKDEWGVLPWDDPMFLWQNSPMAHAHKIKTPLLITHSENDFRVHISEAEQLFAYVRGSGGTTRLVRFPREGHELSRSGEPAHRASRLNHILNWFRTYCQP
jgi:dipeptidyl aminopeptidase/acylaminoacyl peptidase